MCGIFAAIYYALHAKGMRVDVAHSKSNTARTRLTFLPHFCATHFAWDVRFDESVIRKGS